MRTRSGRRRQGFRRRCLVLAVLGSMALPGWAAEEANYEEARVPAYTLPDPLRRADGTRVTTAREWRRSRRAEVLELFRDQMYGRSPGRPRGMRFEVRSRADGVLGGVADRQEVRIWLSGEAEGPWMDLLIYRPAGARDRVPAFLGLNFEGNHAVTDDPGVAITPRWVANNAREGRTNHRATDASRGSEASRWAVRTIVGRGYALATVYYGDLEPDFAEGWREGVRSVFPVGKGDRPVRAGSGVTPGSSDWGAIGAWAWGLSRALDYLETDPGIDARRVAVLGHSRLGKTALWAGAQDERFAMVISNNSGEGGAALARRRFGETTRRINTVFPHWFCANFKRYNDREDDLPFDQHALVALIAPRPVYIASAEKDLWADPRGEFLAAQGAEPVYALFDRAGLGVREMPPVDRPVGDVIGYHVRTGVHDVTDYDWARYLDFADRHLRKRGENP